MFDFGGWRKSKNKIKNLLRCNGYAKTLKKRETLDSKPQQLGKMEL
jgi:hypothetical protein